MQREMHAREIEHVTSECTLRGFTCSYIDMDPRAVTPQRIADARQLQTGHQVESLTSTTGLQVEDEQCLEVSVSFNEEQTEFCEKTAEN
jgi:hypothetical protein